MNTLIEFITSERERYTNKDNNRFAFSLYAVARYWWFLNKIYQRYLDLSLLWHDNRRKFHTYHSTAKKQSANDDMTILPNGGKVNLKVMSLVQENDDIEMGIQLEIESFYLFAKTLLDKLSNAIWVYFGRVHKKGCT